MKQIPFLLTIIAGLSTILGYFTIFFKYNKEKIISFFLSFAAGIMFSLSIIELIPESILFLSKIYSKNSTYIIIVISIVIGLSIPYLIDKFIPKTNNKLYKIGIISMIGIIIHNIPEGIITYLSSSVNYKFAVAMTLAISLHNIPEGISIAIPVYYGTGSRGKAFLMTLIAALSEPIGALIAYFFISDFSGKMIGLTFAFVAGIMIYISIFELLPKALEYKKEETYFFFILGIIFMYLSILLMN